MTGFKMELPPPFRPALQLAALCAFERIRDIRLPRIGKPVLTPREREVLTWVAQGKCAWEIGIILSITKRTVDEHVQSAARKLETVNRPHAVAVAIKDRHIQI
jgi:LuxR family quorum sensing-dependent transcriptional regulator